MSVMDLNEMILRFFKNDIGRILITDEDGTILYTIAQLANSLNEARVRSGLEPQDMDSCRLLTPKMRTRLVEQLPTLLVSTR